MTTALVRWEDRPQAWGTSFYMAAMLAWHDPRVTSLEDALRFARRTTPAQPWTPWEQ